MQYCINCGKKLDNTAKFCSNCGQEVNRPIVQPQAAKPAKTLSSALVFGILGLVFGFFFILGLIFSILAVALSSNPNQSNATAAKVLGWIGIIIALLPLIFVIIIIIVIISNGYEPTTALALLNMF